MNIDKQQISDIFGAFNIIEDIKKWDELVHIEERSDNQLVLKQYLRVFTECSCYILKLLSLPMCSRILLEGQSRFSEFYRMKGILTPKRFVSNKGTFLYSYFFEEDEVLVSVEEDAGTQISEFSEDTIVFMGKLLGKMHAISMNNDCHFRPGSLYTEFKEGKTTYLPLWGRAGTDFLPKDLLERILTIYNERMTHMKEKWEILPRYAVQSDLYRMNLTLKDDQVFIIDYDRVGDEVLLADMLVTWFRFRFDPFIRKFFENPDSMELWKVFLKAYESERSLEKDEKEALPDQYAVIGSVFGTRMLVDEAAKGNKKYAEENLKMILKVLENYGL